MKESLITQSEDMRAYFPEVSTFDILNIDTLRNFDAHQYWESISHQGLPDRQAIATILEQVVITISQMGIFTFLLTFITLCYLVRRWQIKRIKLYYQPTSKMYSEFVKLTDLDKMRYTPWLFALNSHVQGALYTAMEVFLAYFTTLQFSKQIFELSDGGEIALDWLIHPNREDEDSQDPNADITPNKMSQRPILVVIPGLSGDTSNMYCLSPAYSALEQDYDCVIVGYRGLSTPIKVSHTRSVF